MLAGLVRKEMDVMDQAGIDRIERWFHAIDLGAGLVTPDRFPSGAPPNYTLYPVFQFLEGVDIAGHDCLDIGTMDGLVAFMLGLQGAKVVATDLLEREGFLWYGIIWPSRP
jgi:2-polyprenyl-3-methyl-5-hydroxy-6-metoxy-1,4-benzoquinol methylase